jgi:hypothetical protein
MTQSLSTFQIGRCEIVLAADYIWAEPAMGMVYQYLDIDQYKIDAVSCSASFRGIDITRAIAQRFKLQGGSFERAGRLCNKDRAITVVEGDPLIILTPRVAQLDEYTVLDAEAEMDALLGLCEKKSVHTLRICHFAMITSKKAFEHFPGVERAISKWSGDLPGRLIFDVPSRHAQRIQQILQEGTDSSGN